MHPKIVEKVATDAEVHPKIVEANAFDFEVVATDAGFHTTNEDESDNCSDLSPEID